METVNQPDASVGANIKAENKLANHRYLPVALWVGAALLIASGVAFAYMTLRPVDLMYQKHSVKIDEAVEISINQKLIDVSADSISITPKIAGKWHKQQSLTDDDVLRFEPATSFLPDTRYEVRFKKASRVGGVSVSLPAVRFSTEAAPSIDKMSFKSGKVLAADEVFSLKLSSKNRNLRDLQLETNPKIPLARESKDDITFTWKSKDYLPQGKKLQLRLTDSVSGETLFQQTLQVASSPELKSPVKQTNFAKDDTARLEFKSAIDTASADIKFNLAGEGKWLSPSTYEFTPKSVEPGKTYSYTIPKGLRTKQGGIQLRDEAKNFSTPGNVAVVSSSPHGVELAQNRQVIRFAFNQPVDRASAEARFGISRGNVISKNWEGNTLALTATDFGLQESVYAWVDAGVKPVFGLPSVQKFGLSFTTEMPTKKLNVPMYYQQFAQSCEAASVRMALAYRGTGADDWSILQRFGYKPRPLDKNKNIWDDPQLQFVGDVKGDQRAGTGWGVYAEPVAKAIRSYGRQASVRYGVSTGFVADQIYKGNPVVLWGIWNESATQKSWKTPAGRTVSGPVPMHVRLVVGVKGKSSNPVGFYIHDPITGPTYWTAGQLAHNVARAGGANQAVAIH